METTCEPGSFSFGVDCFACLNEDWCLGNTTCAEGHLGYMCSQCGRFLCSLPLSLMSCFFIHRSLPLSLSTKGAGYFMAVTKPHHCDACPSRSAVFFTYGLLATITLMVLAYVR